MYDTGGYHGNYVSDFQCNILQPYPNTISMPHLGASTAEAEENSASMAADEVAPEPSTKRNVLKCYRPA